MRFKVQKNNPIAVLYTAADQIVTETRKVFELQGRDARELRLPILMHGTDLRVTIEAGHKIAARNAIEHAQMQASGQPVEPIVDMDKSIREARALLDLFAAELIAQHRTIPPGCSEWHFTRDTAARCQGTAKALAEVERLL